MKVYVLYNAKHPLHPFYVGITNNPDRRLRQHRTNWKKHRPYINIVNDLRMNVMYDTGDNENSQILAEKIEIQLIRFFNTVNLGSNKVYDVNKYVKGWGKSNNPHLTHEEISKKQQKTRAYHQHQKFKKIIKLICDDPTRYTVDELIANSNFTSENSLNNYAKKYYNTTFKKWLSRYHYLWEQYLRINFETLKR